MYKPQMQKRLSTYKDKRVREFFILHMSWLCFPSGVLSIQDIYFLSGMEGMGKMK